MKVCNFFKFVVSFQYFKFFSITVWCHIMPHTSNCHKTEVEIFNNNGSLSATLAHFRLTNKEAKMTTEII